MYTKALVDEWISKELAKAVAKFPNWPDDPIHAAAVVAEECGELQKAVLQLCYEPHKTSLQEVRSEAIQTAAMAIRFLQSFGLYAFRPGAQHRQVEE